MTIDPGCILFCKIFNIQSFISDKLQYQLLYYVELL